MSYKRKRSESNRNRNNNSNNILLDNDDDCNVFNTMNDTASDDNDDWKLDESPVSRTKYGMIWLDETNASSNVENSEMSDKTSKEFIIDENMITKYFHSAIHSHDYHPSELVGTSTETRTSDTTTEHGPNDHSNNNISLLIKSWEPNEIKLPIWAVVASQK